MFQIGHKRIGGRAKGTPNKPNTPRRKRIATAIVQQEAIDGIFKILAALPLDAPGRDEAVALYTQMQVKVKRIRFWTPCRQCKRRMAYNLHGKRGL